jgi:integrase
VQHFYNRKREIGPSPGTISAMHTMLHDALRQAVHSQVVMRNLSEAPTAPGRKPRKMRPLTLDEVNRLLKAIKQERLFRAIFLELGTGIRKAELLG